MNNIEEFRRFRRYRPFVRPRWRRPFGRYGLYGYGYPYMTAPVYVNPPVAPVRPPVVVVPNRMGMGMYGGIGIIFFLIIIVAVLFAQR